MKPSDGASTARSCARSTTRTRRQLRAAVAPDAARRTSTSRSRRAACGSPRTASSSPPPASTRPRPDAPRRPPRPPGRRRRPPSAATLLPAHRPRRARRDPPAFTTTPSPPPPRVDIRSTHIPERCGWCSGSRLRHLCARARVCVCVCARAYLNCEWATRAGQSVRAVGAECVCMRVCVCVCGQVKVYELSELSMKFER